MQSACLTCGTIKKLGKLSCCARGGSWFGKCGGIGNTKFQHTWHEGIQACKAQQSRLVMGQQQNAVQQNSFDDEYDETWAFTVGGNASIKTSTIMSVSNADAARTSMPDDSDSGAAPDKETVAANVTASVPVDLSIQMPTITEASADMTAFHTPASGSNTVGESESLFSTLPIIICMYVSVDVM